MTPTTTRGFHKLCLVTLVAVYFLILVGGIVRSSGSGMGCPDWPKCFGYWVPPTSVEQLPENYKESFAALRDKKNQKFARYLSAFGFEQTAQSILNDKSILIESDFNATKTWIEYLNRLVGVTIGFLIIALFIRSIWLRQSQPYLFWLSSVTLVLVIIQGWFGSIVVSTNLTSWTITLHMLMAFVLVALVILLYVKSGAIKPVESTLALKIVLVLSVLLLIVQVVLGTEVRAAIDRVSSQLLPREDWISSISAQFIVHRSFSWLVVLFNFGFAFWLIKTKGSNPLTLGLILLILLTLLTGAGMAYFAVPAYLQPVHLLVATVTFGVQFLLFLKLKTNPQRID